jgi:peptidoglycan hydrolase FlgJ
MRVDPNIQALSPERTEFRMAGRKDAKSPEEAARQFEEILVRQFVKTMTKDLFSGSLAGEDGAGWVKAQSEAQGDVLADTLTKHLVESGTLGVAERLLESWKTEATSDRIPGGEPVPVNSGQSLTADDFLRLRRSLPVGGTNR